MKPYYRSKGISIYHGDCREVLPTLPQVDLVLTDPPYGIGFDTDYTRFTTDGKKTKSRRHISVRGDDQPFDPQPWLKFPHVILWGANCFSDRLPQGRWLVWDKRHANGKSWLSDGEVAWMKGGHGTYIYAETCQGFMRRERPEHPTQKAVGLMEWCIGKSRATGLILDPFMGSGTTLVAARNLGRKAIGIELEEKYCEIAAQRLEAKLVKAA